MDIDTLIPPPPAGALFVTLAQALYRPEFLALPLPLHPVAAARLRLARGTYPLTTTRVGGRRMVRVADIRDFASGRVVAEPPPPPAARRGPGRPTKAELAAREAAQKKKDGEVGHD